MSRIALRSVEDAPAEARERLESAEKANGFIPNLLRLLANAPTTLETYQTVSAINARTSLALPEREAVQITAGATHGCTFCVAGHSAIATKKAGMQPDVITALREREEVPDARLDAIAAFTRAVIATRGAVSDKELGAFKAAGYSDQQALEVVLGVSLATLCNFSNNLSQTPLNPELAKFAWNPEGQNAESRAAAE